MFNTFKSLGESVGKNSLYEYLIYYEDAYALFPVPIFNFSETIRQGNPKKIYEVDPGLVTAYSIKPGFEKGACLETAVFNHLRRESKEIFYYRTSQQKEVDFLVMSSKGDFALFQASLSLSETSTRLREIDALIEAALELDLKEGTIITLDQMALRIASNSFLGVLNPRFLSSFSTLSMCLLRSTLMPQEVSISLLRSMIAEYILSLLSLFSSFQIFSTSFSTL